MAIGILGQRAAIDHIDLIRRHTTTTGQTQRVAISALGQVGDQSDIARIEPFANSADRLVSLAAQSALKRLGDGEREN